MSYLKVIFILIISILFFGRCSNSNNSLEHVKKEFAGYEKLNSSSVVKEMPFDESEGKTIKIRKNEIKDFLPMHDYVDSIKYIKLSTDSSCLIGQADNIYVYDNYVILVDKDIAKSVFIFDTNGRHIGTINKKGKGPGEFIELWDVAVDFKNKNILLYDMASKKINFYDYHGNFLKEKKTFFYFIAFEIDHNNNYIFESYGAPNIHLQNISYNYLFVSDTAYKFKYKALPYTSKECDIKMGLGNALFTQGQEITYAPFYENSILSITNDYRLKVKYKFDFGNYTLKYKENLQKMSIPELKKYLKSQSLISFIGYRAETSDVLYFMLSTDNKIVHGFYNKNTGNVILGYGFENSCSKFPSLSNPVTANDNWFVGLVPAYQLIQNKNSSNSKWDKTIKTTKENDNPILVFYKLKRF